MLVIGKIIVLQPICLDVTLIIQNQVSNFGNTGCKKLYLDNSVIQMLKSLENYVNEEINERII